MQPSNLLVVDLETRPDTAILPADRDPSAFPKPIQHEIVTLGFLLARIERDGQGERYAEAQSGASGWLTGAASWLWAFAPYTLGFILHPGLVGNATPLPTLYPGGVW